MGEGEEPREEGELAGVEVVAEKHQKVRFQGDGWSRQCGGSMSAREEKGGSL